MIPKVLVIIIFTLFMHKQPCQIIKMKVKEARRLVQTWFIDDNDTWDDYTIVTWDYDEKYVICLLGKKKEMSCGYCLFIISFVVQGDPHDLLCQHWVCCEKKASVHSLSLQWCECQISPVCIWRHICFESYKYA
jgi:hypothetical protein